MSRFTRNRIKARQQRAEQYRRSGHFYDMPVKKLERLLEYEPDETMQKTCSECKHWQPVDCWQTGPFGIEAEGRCASTYGLSCWNYRTACRKHFEQKKMTAFFYQGGGGTPVEEDIKNVMALTEKLISDNMSE